MTRPGIVRPSAGVSEGPNIFVRFYDTVKAVEVQKARLSDLDHQCNLLLSTVRDCSRRLVEAEASTAEADEIERWIYLHFSDNLGPLFINSRRAVEGILLRISGWERLGNWAAFLRQNQIQIGIEQCYQDLTACTDRFMVASAIVQKSESQEREKERQRNYLALIDMIAKLREEVRKLHSIPLEASQSYEQLLPPQVLEADGQLGQGAVPQVVPSPRSKDADHSGKISRVSERPVIEGSQLLFYIGEWTSDGERTALAPPQRFKEWIEASLGFQHRNILNFTGHVTINDVVYSVNPNPWIENGNIREYLRRYPDADRVRLLSEVASGVEFFHERELLHGDLCDKNILINRDGKAIVCGFDLFEFSNPGVSRARWLAPEQITPASVAAPTEKADIWSFGLLCLEIFTGKDPYHSHSDLYVPVLLNQGSHPEHPGSTAVGLSPKMWDLMQSCWQINPAQRPSMSEIQSTISDMLPRRDGRQPSTGNIDVPVPILFTPAIDTSPPNEARRPTVEMSSPLPPLELTGIPPVTHELNMATSTGFLGIFDQQTDTQAPHRRRRASDSPSSRSRPLPPVPEDPVNPGVQVLHKSGPSQSTARGEREPARPSTAHNRSPSSLVSSDLHRVDSSSSQSTSSKRGLRARLFGNKRSQTTLDTSPGINSDPSLHRRSSSSNSSLYPGPPPAKPPSPNRTMTTPTKPPSPNRTRTMPTKKSSKMVPPQPTRAATLSIDLPQSRNWEPVSPVVLRFMEMAACDSERLLRLATDGTVSAGNLEGLVSRVIAYIEDPSRNDVFIATFLTGYQLFATSERLFDTLKRRFESSELDPVAARSRYPILLFIESWLKKGFADEDLKCTSMIKQLVLPLVDSETISEKMEAKAKEIARLIEDPDYVRRSRSSIDVDVAANQDFQGVKPTDRAAALTVVEGERFKCITYWDYVNFTRCPPNVRRIEVFNIVHDLVKVWVQTTVLESDFLEERMEMYEEWIYTAKECRVLNNFSSTSAIVLGLMSPLVSALVLTCESKAKSDLYALAKELTPTDGVYESTLEKVATRDLIPWLDLHLSALNSSFAHSNPIVEVDGHPLIDFKHYSMIAIAEQIDTLVQYSPPRTRHTTRPDLLAYVEYSLKCSRSNAVLRNAEERSARLAEEERVFYAQRKKMTGLGFAWSPPRRRK
ncbi:hypothetical protein F5888DRAFT_1832576 [Russula emetica]|nr:hypothetical protein F5888DRAFT_1832576 [Russula emetica]